MLIITLQISYKISYNNLFKMGKKQMHKNANESFEWFGCIASVIGHSSQGKYSSLSFMHVFVKQVVGYRENTAALYW